MNDVRLRIVPGRIVLPAAATALVVQTVLDPSAEWLLSALAAAGFLFAVVLAYPKGLGMGDVKLALLLGAVLGASVSVALMFGLLVAVALAAWLGTTGRKTGVPLVPFLSIGSLVALFLGERILDLYLGMF